MKAFVTIVCLCILQFGQSQIVLPEQWKFSNEDDWLFAEAEYDDRTWKSISSFKHYEDQEFPDHNGFSWYRISFNLNSNIKITSFNKDSIIIKLPMIDDVDQCYLNGKIIGKTGSLPTDSEGFKSAKEEFREYTISVDDPDLKWNKTNVIAIRVYDHDGNGGAWGGKLGEVMMKEDIDYVVFDGNAFDLQYTSNEISKNVVFINKSNQNKSGIFETHIKERVGEKRKQKDQIEIKLKGHEKKIINWTNIRVDNATISFKFTDKTSKRYKEFVIETPYILTPEEKASPVITNPSVYAMRPYKSIQWAINVTGSRPITFAISGLTEGLTFDATTGIIEGQSPEDPGEYEIKVVAKNEFGKTDKKITIYVADDLALTPPMGWSSWHAWGSSVTDDHVRKAAEKLHKTGLVNYGWNTIIVDDGWQKKRNDEGTLEPKDDFPNMTALCEDIHNLGMKCGIFSSPAETTCTGKDGSHSYELRDVQKFAEWGIDYLKYDWCNYSKTVEKSADEMDISDYMKPFNTMRAAIDETERDIVLHIGTDGIGDPWTWAKETGANIWRTGSDITDNWQHIINQGFGQYKYSEYTLPGGWNDPDHLMIGYLSEGRSRLTPTEQYSQMSLWALLSAPLFISCDLDRLDDFTYNLMANHEIIAINQDILVKPASRIYNEKDWQIWTKELNDGSLAVGIFNMGPTDRRITFKWEKFEITGYKKLRDPWRQKELGKISESYTSEIFSHGVTLLVLKP